jgi:hypothetical protein
MKNNGIQPCVFGREISRSTVINPDTGIIIATSNEKSSDSACEKLKAVFGSIGCKVQVLINPGHDVMHTAKAPVIVIGNISNSKCVKHLYYKLLCLTDKWYPGEGGYNIRTLINPFGTGFNIIHIGYSDNKGQENALAAFIKKVGNPMPYYNDVSYTNLPCAKKYIERITSSPFPNNPELLPSINASYWWYMGYIAYLTVDDKLLCRYVDGWKKVIELSGKNHGIIGGSHLHMMTHIEAWRLLEYSGMIPDDIRGNIEECVYNWAQSAEGKVYIEEGLNKILPSHNHSMFCALALTYAADFFKNQYKGMQEPDEWLQAADDVFYTFNHSGWKPYCDDSMYSTHISLPLVCMYSIFDDTHEFLENGGKKAAEWVKTLIGHNAFIPSFGDGTVNTPLPSVLLRILSHYYNDGELKYLLDSVPDERNLLPEICIQGMFDSGVKPDKPEVHIPLNIIPLDHWIYDSWSKDMRLAKGLTATPPYGPYGNCFDKLCIRTGWDEEDEFLLIDGLGSNGIHSYSDAMGVLDYTSRGITWLVEENCYRWPEPENCCILTITRDGYASEIPGIALLEKSEVFGNGDVYLKMKLSNYNGVDWIREVIFIKGLCVVFHDTVVAIDEGGYVVCSHFKTPGKARLEGNVLKCTRENSRGKKFELRLSGFGSSLINMRAYEIPLGEMLFSHEGTGGKDDFYNHGVKMAELGREMWLKRYNESSVSLTAVVTRSSQHLDRGGILSLIHIVHPAGKDDCDIIPCVDNKQLCIKYNGKVTRLPVELTDIYSEEMPDERWYACNRLELRRAAALPDNILKILHINKEIYVCACDNGSLILLDNGTVSWKYGFGGDIHSLAYINQKAGMLLVGNGNNKLSALNMQGTLLWETSIEGKPTIFLSYEMRYPQVMEIKCCQAGDMTVIAAGCGDNHIRVYDPAGNLLSCFYVYATVPDTIEFLDINGDGNLEILAAGREQSSQGVFFVHDIHGNPGDHIYTGGWLCNIKSYVINHLGDKIRITCGMNYGENFKVFDVVQGRVETAVAERLGGSVDAICSDNNGEVFYAGTSKGFVVALDKQGARLWYIDINKPVQDILYVKAEIIAVCSEGEIFRISDKGIIIGSAILPAPVACCLKEGDKLLFGCNGYLYSL